MNFEPTHRTGRARRLAIVGALAVCASLMALPAGGATAASGGISAGGGGGATVPGDKAKLRRNGKAVPPENAPWRVKRAIRAGNKIDDKRYCLGGGHGSWRDRCYDCSGAASYVLGRPGAKLLRSPMPSGSFSRWGKRGRGKWITVYSDAGHMFLVVAGLRFDTSMPDDGESGPGWSKRVKQGFRNVSRTTARHKGRF